MTTHGKLLCIWLAGFVAGDLVGHSQSMVVKFLIILAGLVLAVVLENKLFPEEKS